MIFSSGIGRYIRGFVPFIIDEFNVTLLIRHEDKHNLLYKCNYVTIKSSIYSIKEQVELFLKVPKSDIFWSPHYNVPFLPIRARCRVVTIHDVFHLAHNKSLSTKQKLYAYLMMRNAVRSADVLLTVSMFTASELQRHLNVTKNISVIYNATSSTDFYPLKHDDINYVYSKYGLSNKFILYVGNVKPHKNLCNLLQAIKDESDLNLVIVGNESGFITSDNDIFRLLENNTSLKNRVKFTGFVNDNELSCIYNLATLFVFPSIYEGFGIPPLEAQACGCPVVCSDIESLSEVCGDSALYFDPYSPDDILDKILKLYDNKTLQKKFIEKGFKNIQRFAWKKSAENLIKLLQKANNG